MRSLGELPTSGGVGHEGSSHVRLGSVRLRGHRPVGLAQSSPTPGACHALGEGCQRCPLPPVGVGRDHTPRPHPEGLLAGPRDSGRVSQHVGGEGSGGQEEACSMTAVRVPSRHGGRGDTGPTLSATLAQEHGKAGRPCRTHPWGLWAWGGRSRRSKYRASSLL